jgi:hypothetical protein
MTTPPTPIVSFTVGNSRLPMPGSQTTLTWQTVGAASCSLSWLDRTTTVTYGSQGGNPAQVTSGVQGNVPTQVTGDAPVNVTVLADDTFTLTAISDGISYSRQLLVQLVPTFTAVTNPPVVTGVSPTTGDLAGGEQVTITGSGLLGTTTVLFGGAAGSVVSVDADTQITVIAPPGTQAGTVDITVATLTGISSVTPMDRFGYTAQGLPVVSGVSPATGNVATAPASVTISGSGFGTDPTKVTVNFGPAPATVTAVTDSQITVTAPATPFSGVSGTGVVDVTLTTPAGTSAATAADWFTYWLPGFPMVTAVSPVSGVAGGDPSGGDLVTISGSGFTGVISVTFGGTPGVVTASSDTELSVITPLGAENSTVDVVVQVQAGDSPVVPASHFTYAAVPRDVSPQQIFRLIWSCPAGTEPYLTWAISPGGTASVMVAGHTVSEGDHLPTDSGWASVTINALTTFTLQLTYGTSPAGSRQVSVNQLTLSGFSVSSHVVDSLRGTQSVWFTWNAAYVAGLSLTNTSLTGGPATVEVPANATSYTAQLPLSGFPPGPMTYTLTAAGADESGNYTTLTEQVKVEPYPVSIGPFWMRLYVSDAVTGEQSVLVEWTPAFATSVTLTAGTTTLHPGIHDRSASVPLPLPPVPPAATPTTRLLYPVTLSATGYVKPGIISEVSFAMPALEVQLSGLSAKELPPKPPATRATVGLTWTATAATWLVLNGVGYPPDTPQPVSLPWPTTTGFYSMTAYGYATGAPWPTQETSFKVGKEGKDRIGKESIGKESISPESVPQTGMVAAGPDDTALPDGTEQAFITPEERPDVGARFRDADPAA